jgi:hypothetical protein
MAENGAENGRFGMRERGHPRMSFVGFRMFMSMAPGGLEVELSGIKWK